MKALSVKIFDVEFSPAPDLYVLKSSEFKKGVFGDWSVGMYVCVWLYDEYLATYTSKTSKDRNIKFYGQYQISE